MKEYRWLKEFVQALWAVYGICIVFGIIMLVDHRGYGVWFVVGGISGLQFNLFIYLLTNMAVDLSEVILWMRVDQDEKEEQKKVLVKDKDERRQ